MLAFRVKFHIISLSKETILELRHVRDAVHTHHQTKEKERQVTYRFMRADIVNMATTEVSA